MIGISVTGHILIEFSSEVPFGGLVKFHYLSRIPYTDCTIFLLSIRGAVHASGEGEIFLFSVYIIVCIVVIFLIFGGLVYCRKLPGDHNSISRFLSLFSLFIYIESVFFTCR